MFSFIMRKREEDAFIKNIDRILKKLEDIRTNVMDITEAGEFCLSHLPVIKFYSVKAYDEIMKSKVRFEKESPLSVWARNIIDDGKRNVSSDELIAGLTEADRDYMMTIKELCFAKEVLYIEIAKAFVSASERTLKDENERMKAEKWAEKEDVSLPGSFISHVFFEYALKLSAEKDDSKKKEILENRLALMGRSEEDCIRVFAEEQSERLVRLQNLIGMLYTVKNINWEKTFYRVSFTEKKLEEDPSGIYSTQDEESKGCVRNALERLSKEYGISERAAASKAVELAKRNSFKNVPEALLTDEGIDMILSSLHAEKRRKKKTVPDPDGYMLICAHLGILILMSFLMIRFVSVFAVVFAFPLTWTSAKHIISRFIVKTTAPKPLLRLNMKNIPEEARTIVMVPALITSEERGKELMRELETYGVHSRNDNVDFLLLADFKDGRNEVEKEDSIIRRKIIEIQNEMNLRAGRKKYFYLNRKRIYNEQDNVWMGRERKRGAIEDFNLLALGYENRFGSESEDAKEIIGRYKYAVTLDADTQMIPGTIEKMIEAIHHPMNKKYAVIQPRMEFIAERKQSRFRKCFAGVGGSDIYNACAQEPYMDFTGNGLFSGKGIYRIKEFFESTYDKYDENTVLSHDLIEGILSGCAYAGDIVLFESFPKGVKSYLKRLERWTRGDWQLLRYAFGKIKIRNIDRYKVFDNVIRSLSDASALLMLLISAWTGKLGWMLTAFLLFVTPYASRFPDYNNLFARVCLLPETAAACLTGAVRAVYRMLVSHKNMLSWVTADDADKSKDENSLCSSVYSLFLLPSVFSPTVFVPSAVLSAFFIAGSRFLKKDANEENEASFTLLEYAFLTDLAQNTWKYFERHVKPGKNALPPDNVQLDPPKGAAMRTSPTNIAMYIASTVSAHLLDLINESEMHARLKETAKEIGKLQKWNGLLYNWYDTETNEPMNPKYVSSVDCGNLIASYVLARNAVRNSAPEISDMFQKLIQESQIEALYDPDKKLFRIGYDAQRDVMSESYYDLIASEARILSYTAMAERNVEEKHWYRLSRPCERIGGECVLKSWSGTMFEYLMPFLFLPSAKGTLFSDTANGVIELQEQKSTGNIWGISESGYMSFDSELNYQYKAFGVGELALSGDATGHVIAPYAAVLALPIQPKKTIKNLMAMKDKGLFGEYGFYEAVDYSTVDTGETVFSYMSHHQGMALCALANALTDNALQRIFMEDAREKAYEPVLNEKTFRGSVRNHRKDKGKDNSDFYVGARDKIRGRNYERHFTGNREDAHMIFSNNAQLFLTEKGEGFYRKEGIYANEWHQNPQRYEDKLIPDISANGRKIPVTGGEFGPGYAKYYLESDELKGEIECSLSPETDSMLIMASITNKTTRNIKTEICHRFKVALCDEESIFAHPVFKDLFIEKSTPSENMCVFERRKRTDDEKGFVLYHSAYGGHIEKSKKVHPKLGIFSSLSSKKALGALESNRVYFCISLRSESDENTVSPLTKAAFARSKSLAAAFNKTMIRYIGLSAREYRIAEEAFRKNCIVGTMSEEGEFCEETLWPLGLSGDQPLLLAVIKEITAIPALKKLISVYELMRMCRVDIPLVIIHVSEVEYFTPVRDKIEAILSSGRMAGLCGQENGIYVFDEKNISKKQYLKLESLSVFIVKKDLLKDAGIEKKINLKESEKTILPMLHDYSKLTLVNKNIYGGFHPKNGDYVIFRSKDTRPPAAWANFLANDDFGAIVTDRGIGCIWHKNSRNGRMTPYDNDVSDKVQTVSLDMKINGKVICLLPGYNTLNRYKVTHSCGYTTYETEGETLGVSSRFFVDSKKSVLSCIIEINNKSEEETELFVSAKVDFLMGTDVRDKSFLKRKTDNLITTAEGRMKGTAFAGFKDGETGEDGSVIKKLTIKGKETGKAYFMIGISENPESAKDMLKDYDFEDGFLVSVHTIKEYNSKIIFDTSDVSRDLVMNGFVKYQTLASRIRSKCGMYQPGGAYGFRDQLQDMLQVMYFDPARARNHILYCAEHQFPEGDALHWWHEPARGVRTKISDDVLFLSYVTAKYISLTLDKEILKERVPYLKSIPIPDNKEDLYLNWETDKQTDTLYAHIMAAFKKVYKKGENGLLLMGGGDWNDGMNRIGAEGRGESVWLSEFAIVCADLFSKYADKEDKAYLEEMICSLKEAVEEKCWEGQWYLRAFNDAGEKIGSAKNKECRIDLISQAWAAFAGMDEKRVITALKSAWELLMDREAGIIKLLTPPFSGLERDPGYISKYPTGVRENGGQYTHAACWYVKALSKYGFANEAWRAFDMLLPLKRSDSSQKARHYLAEPYVIAADISYGGDWTGVGGWTWYTGAAAWAFCVMLEDLLGFERKGDRVKMQPLLSDNMEKVSVTIRYKTSVYRLIGTKDAVETEDEIELTDDGKLHVIVFAARKKQEKLY